MKIVKIGNKEQNGIYGIYYRTYFSVGVQTFYLDATGVEELEDAEFFARQLEIAFEDLGIKTEREL